MTPPKQATCPRCNNTGNPDAVDEALGYTVCQNCATPPKQATPPVGGHTPGPWFAKNGVVYRRLPDQGIMTNPPIKVGSGWREDAWCDDDADAESLANANLIACAPDLLDVATWAAATHFGCEHGLNGGFVSHSDFCIATNAAIAKAKGGAS